MSGWSVVVVLEVLLSLMRFSMGGPRCGCSSVSGAGSFSFLVRVCEYCSSFLFPQMQQDERGQVGWEGSWRVKELANKV